VKQRWSLLDTGTRYLLQKALHLPFLLELELNFLNWPAAETDRA